MHSFSYAHCTALHAFLTGMRRNTVPSRLITSLALLPSFLAAAIAKLLRAPAAARHAVHAAEQPLPLLLLPGGHQLLRQAVLRLP